MVSLAFLMLQVAATRYSAGGADPGTALLWFAVGALLLWLVDRRRSRVARGLVIVSSLAGAVLYGLGALADAHAALLAIAFLGQALPLMARPVRLHVRSAG